jgi:hypothetical protein
MHLVFRRLKRATIALTLLVLFGCSRAPREKEQEPPRREPGVGSPAQGQPEAVVQGQPDAVVQGQPNPLVQGQPDDSSCSFLSKPASSSDETAWRLFVAASCPTSGKFAWENWIEKMTLYPAGKSLQSSALKRRLHGSGLEAAVRAAKARRAGTPPSPAILEANQGCRPIHTFNGKLPDNVKEKGTICEETRINSFAESFVHEHKFERRVGQVEAVHSGLARIVWPTPSIELKVMWIPATSLIKSFSCDKPDPILHTEVIDGECYAMVGMHLASKLYENWLWATFEVKDERTNPLRCIWFGPCRDTWGTTPEISNGGPKDATALTPALLKLMGSAGLGDQLRIIV